jgi:hypothetical protein
MKRTKDTNCIAVLGLVGWHVQGRSQWGTFSSGPYDAPPGDCLAIDMSSVYRESDNAAGLIWSQPNLDLGIPNGNVRSLFEGCIGCDGTLEGHPWDGSLDSLKASDGVGLDVYIAILKAQGGKVVQS